MTCLDHFTSDKRRESTGWDLDRVKLMVLTENKKVPRVGVNFNHRMTSMPIPEIRVEVSTQGRKLR